MCGGRIWPRLPVHPRGGPTCLVDVTQPKGLRRRRDAPTGMRRPVRSVVVSVWVGFPFLCFFVCYMLVCVWYVSWHRVLDLVLVLVLSLPWEMFFGTV